MGGTMKKIIALAIFSAIFVLCTIYSSVLQTIPLRVSQSWKISLQADPTNRYQWEPVMYNTDLIQVTVENEGASTVFTITAKQIGSTNILFIFRRVDAQQRPSQTQEYRFTIS